MPTPATSQSPGEIDEKPVLKAQEPLQGVQNAELPRQDAQNLHTSGWSQRVGPLGLAILLGSLVCILGSLAFLYFLWLGDATNGMWQRLVLAGWVTRSITIASLVIRVLIAAQAAFCTSLIAALLLQKGPV